MSNDFIYTFFYLIFWIFALVYVWKKTKITGASFIIISSYIIYSIFSLLLVNSSFYNFSGITLFPYFYLFGMMFVLLLPIIKFESIKPNLIISPSVRRINLISIIFIISSFLSLPGIIISFYDGIIKLFTDSLAGNEMYNESMEITHEIGGGIQNLPAIISGAFSGIGYLLTFYYFTLNNRNKYIQWGLIISCVSRFLSGISSGQRGLVVEPLLYMIVTYFLLKRYYTVSIRKLFYSFGILLVILVSFPLVAITFSRFDNSVSDPFESVYYYGGQASLYFNQYGLDDGGIRYGDRTIPLFKRLLLFDNVPRNFWERREKYPKLSINDEVFSTHVGDLAIDFGPVMAFFIIILLTFIFYNKTKATKTHIYFNQIILLHMLCALCMIGGLKLFPFADVGGNLKIIVYIASVIYLNKSNQI